MARNASNRHFNAQSRDLVRQAGLVSFGVTLPDLYCDMIVAGELKLRVAVRLYQQRLSDYVMDDKAVH